jgi:hypothetical protein
MSDTKPNPANAAATPAAERRRIPMSIPQRKLQVDPIAGYHTHWFRDDNIERAIQAGYEFVDCNEVTVNQQNTATSRGISGNADLGTRVRVVSGMGQNGPEYLTLMKIKEEWHREDMAVLEKRNASVMEAIFQEGKVMGDDQQNPGDKRLNYVKTADAGNMPLFNRLNKKGRLSSP